MLLTQRLLGSPNGLLLVNPGYLSPPLTLTRAQVSGVQSTAIDGGNNGLTFYGADVPRFNGSAQRLLIEGQGTTVIKNPRCEGAVAGSPGTFPTGWFVAGNGQGINWNVAGTGTESGIPYVDLRISGTSTGTVNAAIVPTPFGASVAPNQTWTHSIYFRRVAGSLTGITSLNLDSAEFNSSVAFLRNTRVSILSEPTSFLSSRRVLTAIMGASTVLLDLRVNLNPAAGVAVDATFRISAPQLKQLPFADTPSFPPVGTPVASTRGVDLVSASLASLGIAASGACTVLWSGVVPNFITGATHTIACLDDGSVNNRITMRIDQASGQLQAQRSLAGASTTANAGAVTAGAAIKGGMVINGSGRAAVSLNGGAVAAVTGGPSSGLTQLRLGNLFDGSAPMWGETLFLRILPAVSDSELQSLIGAMP